MSKKVKLEAGQWYRTRGRKIVYVFGKRIAGKSVFSFLAEFKNGYQTGFTKDGRHTDGGGDSIYDLVEHLPGCDGFDWEPPKPQPKYRPFKNAKEFKPHRDKWWKYKDGDVVWPPACYSDKGYSDTDWDYCFENQVFEDGTPFGVEVTE